MLRSRSRPKPGIYELSWEPSLLTSDFIQPFLKKMARKFCAQGHFRSKEPEPTLSKAPTPLRNTVKNVVQLNLVGEAEDLEEQVQVLDAADNALLVRIHELYQSFES